MVTLRAVLPPCPAQLRVKVVAAVIAPVDWLPERALAPAHPPLAVQELALSDDQLSNAGLPLVTDAEAALKVTVGAAAGTGVETNAVMLFDVVPPGPLQLTV